MRTRKIALALATAALAAAISSCHDDEAAAGPGALTLKQFAAGDITGNTREDNDPVELNDLFVDTSSEDPAEYDDLLRSS